jgi:hypothetical protein
VTQDPYNLKAVNVKPHSTKRRLWGRGNALQTHNDTSGRRSLITRGITLRELITYSDSRGFVSFFFYYVFRDAMFCNEMKIARVKNLSTLSKT